MDETELPIAILGVFSFAYCITDSILTIFFRNSGLNNIQIALVLSTLAISTIVSSPIVGGLAEYSSKKFLLIVSIILTGSSYILIAFFQTYSSFILSQMILGMGVSGIGVISLADLEEHIKGNRSYKTAVSFAAQYLGKFIGPLSGGVMAAFYGMRTSILFSGLSFVILLFLVLFFYKDNRRVKMNRDVIDILMDFKKFMKSDQLFFSSVIGFMEYMMINSRYMLTPLLLFGYGLSITKIGIVIASFYLISFVLEPAFGKLIDKLNIGKTTLFASFLLSFSFILFYVSSNFYVFILAALISSVAVGILDITTSESIYMASGNHEESYGFFFGVCRIGGLIGFVISGIISQIIGIKTTFALLSVMGMAIIVYAIYTRPKILKSGIFKI